MRKKHLAALFHNLASLLNAGVPLFRSLHTIATGRQKTLLKRIEQDIAAGDTFADALAHHPRTFSRLDILAVEAGERSGLLGETLADLAVWHELNLRTNRRMAAGLVYPAFLIHAAALLGPLPLYFMGRIDLLAYLSRAVSVLALFYVPFLLILFLPRLIPHAGFVRLALDTLMLKIPLLRRALLHQSLARYCRAFHLLLMAGVPAAEIAQRSADVAGNALLAARLRPAVDAVRNGQPFSDGFSPRLPTAFREAFRVGEETGNLDETTRRLADSAAEQAEFFYLQFARWFPFLIYLAIMLYMAYLVLTAYSAVFTLPL